MTRDKKQTAAANAGATPAAVCASYGVVSGVGSLPLRRDRDAVCRDLSADGSQAGPAVQADFGAASPDSSATSKHFFTSRMKSQPQTRKETPNTTQEKKGKKQQEQNSLQLETLA